MQYGNSYSKSICSYCVSIFNRIKILMRDNCWFLLPVPCPVMDLHSRHAGDLLLTRYKPAPHLWLVHTGIEVKVDKKLKSTFCRQRWLQKVDNDKKSTLTLMRVWMWLYVCVIEVMHTTSSAIACCRFGGSHNGRRGKDRCCIFCARSRWISCVGFTSEVVVVEKLIRFCWWSGGVFCGFRTLSTVL